ncbi:hypothetical protein GA707_08750 [Nostocoides sp. F2B08]|uniref:hypothetical protein n=1 Tax=Nostocoides sp. F2B08 TaxID=2653936 RepID=UPI001263861D|nr:hypothetical protein [Tetrasphaera sp. F2B08]KAB7744672.1 hypothetical protein GA707_08750 [Tetrasphaera sp. F2B08]
MPKVTAKKKCCKDKPRCKKCPVVLSRLTTLGYGERHPKDKRRYVLAGSVPKKTMKVARAR